jgi:hypothetical protein
VPPISAAVRNPFWPTEMFHSTPGKPSASTMPMRSPMMARTAAT